MNWLAVFTKSVFANPRYRAVLALVLGLLLTFAYQPFAQGWIAPLVLAVWLILLLRSQTPKQALSVGFCFGFGWFGAGISWVFVSIDQFGGMPLIFSILIMVVLWAYLALFPAFSAWLWFKTRRFYSGLSLLAVPVIWLISESLRGRLFTGFPWLSLGYTQTSTTLGQLAPHIGEIGLSVLVILSAIGFVFALLRRQIGWLLIPLSCYTAGLYAPQLNPMQTTGESVNVALVQGNIELDLKWDPDRQWVNLHKYMDMSRPYYDEYDLIVWPESAITALEDTAGRALNQIDELAASNNTAVISGIIDHKLNSNYGGYYNSIIVMGEQANDEGYSYGNSNRYEKHQLLPVGEFVPFESLLRPLAPLFNLPMSSFQRGDYQQPNLQANNYRIAANVCYEVAFPRQIAANVHPETQLLLTVSNDSWFGDSHGPHQHLEIARMRAMELGRPMLRSTNSGMTALIDERGRTITQIEPFIADVATGRVALVEGTTFYHRLGSAPTWAFALLVALLALNRRKKIAKS